MITKIIEPCYCQAL